MKHLIILPLILFASCVYGQLDNIEYNWWSQVLKFEIKDNQYFFKTWNDSIIESDDLLFNSDKFFENFGKDGKHPDYMDSIEMVITSRTMKKSYLESPLVLTVNSLRICWMRDSLPIIFTIPNLDNDNYSVFTKIGDGKARFHGNIVFDTVVKLSDRNIKKLNKYIDIADLINIKNEVVCIGGDYLLNVFYVEFIDNGQYNVFVINECNLREKKYNSILEIFNFLEKKLKIKKVRPLYW